MVLTGIQPRPENMQKLASSRGIMKCIPIPAGARAALSSHCIGPYELSTHTQLHNSATSLTGLHHDSPQRSAGSFNMVHPVRTALLPTKLMSNHTATSLTKVDHDENDMICLCSSSLPMEGGTPSSSSSSCLLPSFISRGNSWEDQPIKSNGSTVTSYTDHLQTSVLMEPSTNSRASKSTNITRIGSAESISTASSARLLGKGQSTRFSLGSEKFPSRSTQSQHVFPKDQTTFFDNEKMISAEDEYGSLTCCLQGDFWAHPDGTLCDCEPLFKQEEHGMQIDDMIFDILLPGSLLSDTTSKTVRHEVVDEVAEYRSECMMNSLCSSLDMLGDGQDGGFGSTSNLSLIGAAESHFAPGVYSSSIQANNQFLDEVGRGVMQERNSGKSAQPITTLNSDYNGNHGGRPHLVRSCSLTILPPTRLGKGVEQISPSLLRSSSLSSDGGIVQSRKRSFSASELSSGVDHPESLIRNLYESRSQLQSQMQLHAALLVKQRAVVRLQKQGNLMQPSKQDDNQDGISNGLLPAGLKERSNPIQTSDEAVRKKGGRNQLYAITDQLLLHNQLINKEGNIKNNIVCEINDDLKYNRPIIKQAGIKSNLQQIKQARRRHGTATDPQSVAARTRREKFSERIRMLQGLVPNGERLDTVSMLGQTLEYIRFLQHQVWELCHGSDGSPPLPINACEKWKDFMQSNQHAGNTSSTTSP